MPASSPAGAPASRALPTLNYLYIEEAARSFPLTKSIQELYPHIPHIPIRNYGEIFNRKSQHFQVQKRMPALILAAASGKNLLYPGNERIATFENMPLYYTDQLRNCPFNCHYCFLQGMHRSAHLLLFVNSSDFHQAVTTHIQQARSAAAPPASGAPAHLMHLSVSYLSDLLGFEYVAPLCRQWIEYARTAPDILLEIRTKSNNIHALKGVDPIPNARLVWSLTPASLVKTHEPGTASLPNRLLAARTAAEQGWRLHLAFDPILTPPGWQALYTDLIGECFRRIPADAVDAVTIGVFRMHPEYFKNMRSQQPHNPLLRQEYQRSDRLISVEHAIIDEIKGVVGGTCARHIPEGKIYFVHG